MPTAQKPRRCPVTKVGLIAFAITAAALMTTFVWQWAVTGSFDRDTGFRAPMWVRMTVLYGAPSALGVLVVGALCDSVRYSAWKKRSARP